MPHSCTLLLKTSCSSHYGCQGTVLLLTYHAAAVTAARCCIAVSDALFALSAMSDLGRCTHLCQKQYRNILVNMVILIDKLFWTERHRAYAQVKLCRKNCPIQQNCYSHKTCPSQQKLAQHCTRCKGKTALRASLPNLRISN